MRAFSQVNTAPAIASERSVVRPTHALNRIDQMSHQITDGMLNHLIHLHICTCFMFNFCVCVLSVLCA